MLVTRTSIFSRIARTLDLPITEDQVLAYENGALLQDAFPNLTAEEREFYKTGMTAEEWNQMFREDILHRKIREIDSISEFGADNFHITTHPVFGLQRWTDKQYMLSFFPTDIKNNRLQYQSKIDKVYDLFLTEEQVEVIVEEYNRRNGIFSE